MSDRRQIICRICAWTLIDELDMVCTLRILGLNVEKLIVNVGIYIFVLESSYVGIIRLFNWKTTLKTSVKFQRDMTSTILRD